MHTSIDSIMNRVRSVRARLTRLSLLAGSLAAGCVAQTHPGTQPPPSTATIIATYRFDTLGGVESFPITVRFSGSLMTATGSEGATSFDSSVMQTIMPSQVVPAMVSYMGSGLKAGTWKVAALPSAVGGFAECTVTLPGSIVLDVSGGTGLHCR